MADIDEIKEIIINLQSMESQDKVKELQNLSEGLQSITSANQLTSHLSSILINHISNLIIENKKDWVNDFPTFILLILYHIYGRLRCNISIKETAGLIEITKDYYKEKRNVIPLLKIILYVLVCSQETKLLLLADQTIYYIIAKKIKKGEIEESIYAVKCLVNASEECPNWQQKILADRELISKILEISDREEVWMLFLNLCHNQDAKLLLPKEVIEKAKIGGYDDCTSVYAMLCSEDEAAAIKFNESYISGLMENLEFLLRNQDNSGCILDHNLIDLILPLVNLSVADANKESLGKSIIGILLKVLIINETNSNLVIEVSSYLSRAKEEAAKTLWNLAFAANNCERINKLNGKTTLQNILQKTKNKILQRNVEGVLYMLETKQDIVETPRSTPARGHVMISYNWGCQATVLRISQSLKVAGYKVWIDIEQMNGSTLEAMAQAIEKSEAVLLCMSQKYKDSPNCRLEGEYCVNRKVFYVPLMMQQEYSPDGWLGIALGSKLWYDFTSQENWDIKISALIAAIGHRAKVDQNNTSTNEKDISSSQGPATITKGKSTACWNNEDILEWMKREGIDKHYNNFIEQAIDGRALLELKTLLVSNNHYSFLSFLSQQFSILQLGDVLRISAALRKLT